MAIWDRELRHIVDVDGQLLGIDQPEVDVATLLARACLPPDRCISLVLDGQRIPIGNGQRIRLSERDVLVFETSTVARPSSCHRFAN